MERIDAGVADKFDKIVRTLNKVARATRKIQRHEGAEKRSSRKRTRAKSSTEAAV